MFLLLIGFTNCYADKLMDLEIMLQAVLSENAEAKKQIQLLQKKSKIMLQTNTEAKKQIQLLQIQSRKSAARTICYSALPRESNHALILFPLKNNHVDLDKECHKYIHKTWHAGGIAKGHHSNQNCVDIDNSSYGGYTSYTTEKEFEGHREIYKNCNIHNAFICCSPQFPN